MKLISYDIQLVILTEIIRHDLGCNPTSTSVTNQAPPNAATSSVSGEQSSDVLEWLLHSGHRCHQPTPTISQPPSTDCTLLSAIITFGCRAFSVAGATVWNSLSTKFGSFGDFMHTHLKRYYSHDISAFGAKRGMHDVAIYKFPVLFYSILSMAVVCVQL